MLTASQGGRERGGIGVKILHHVVDECVIWLSGDDGEGFDREFRDDAFDRETHGCKVSWERNVLTSEDSI